MPKSEAEIVQIGRGIARRIEVREKSRLQMRLVRDVFRLPIGASLVLRGGSALHRVYLNRRWSEDLDFLVPHDAEACLYEELARHGLSACRSGVAHTEPGLCFKEIGVGLDACGGWSPADRRLFTGLDGDAVWVNAQPLPDILCEKLHCVVMRGTPRASDFADLWWGLPRFLGRSEEVRRRVAGRWGVRFFEAAAALERLDTTRTCWMPSLESLTACVPPYAQVRSDLGVWLPLFEGDA